MNKSTLLVRKNTGDSDYFDEAKLRSSLEKTGATHSLIDEVTDQLTDILYDGITTKEIYHKAHQLLKKKEVSTASRYRLKQSILELGPTGYPFELFVGELMKAEGYQVQVGIMQTGKCVSHEVDVLAENDQELLMLECKFHNRQGYKTDVKVPLYIHSRFKDLEYSWKKSAQFNQKKLHAGVITNGRLTQDAIDYGRCTGLRMTSWDYPGDRSLKNLVDRHKLYPITSLQHLKKREKQVLLDQGIILIKSICENTHLLDNLNLKGSKYDKLIEEANLLCRRT